MTGRSRRTILCGTAGLFAFAAGCLDETDDSSGDGDSGDGSNDDGEPDKGATGDTDDETGSAATSLEAYDNVPFDLNRPRDPDAALLIDADGARNWLAERELDAERYADFVDETSFDDSILLGLEAEAPQLNYELALETVSVDATADEEGDDASLTVEAAVTETTDGEDSGDVGGTQVITVGQLVRATFDGEPLTRASVTIVDGDGNSHDFGLSVDSTSESADAEETADG